MSKETMEWLNTQTLIGFTEKFGEFWHYDESLQGDESNHYVGAIPVADVVRRLFHWEALSAPVKATYEFNGETIEVTDATRQAIIRPDTQTILGLFKDGYQIHQYKQWLLDEVAQLLDSDLGTAIGSAGLLEMGGMAWVQIELPETFTHDATGEQVRPRLLATTSMNGKLSSTYKMVMQRVGCDNTLKCGLSEKSATIKVKHSKYSDLKIGAARETLGIFDNAVSDYWAELEALESVKVTPKQFLDWRDAMVPLPEKDGRAKTMAERKRDAFSELWISDARVAPWNGTAWGILQTANTYTQHVAPVHTGTDRNQKNIFGAATGKLFESDNLAMATLDKVLSAAL